MKKRDMGAKILFDVFIIVICFSWLWWIILEKYVDSTNYENRVMATRPRLTADNYLTYANDYTLYFNDAIPFRNNLITLNNEIDYFIFNKSSSDYVIAGKHNWLFYSREEDSNPIGCYQGTNIFTDEELQEIARNCTYQRDFLLSQGKEFVIFIAPNKERVYCEYMPAQYGKPAGNYGALQIYTYLKENTDLRIIYAYTEIMDAKEQVDANIYYKTDTHWNYVGGYVGARTLMKELGIEMPEVYSEEITITENGTTSGDLASMLNLSNQLKYADKEYVVEGYNVHGREEIAWDVEGMIQYHATNADPRAIYVIRDSFSSHMALYIGSQFTDSYLRHRSSYSYDDFVACNPDIVVYETVERYVGGLKSFSIQ